MRRALFFGASAVWMIAAWGGCSGKSNTSGVSLNTSSSGTGGASLFNQGVGEDCNGTDDCRSGLVCADDGTCQPGHDTEDGQPCVISAECLDGSFCSAGVCAPAGSGEDGASCASDADCASGFRCQLDGLSASCVPEGATDVGGACESNTDCFGGIACVEGSCQVLPPGIPPFGLPWAGVACEPEVDGSSEALFHVPRGDDSDMDFFSLPFPNDVRLTGTTVDLTDFPTPGDAMLGFDPVQRYVDAIEADDNAWGIYQTIFFRFTGRLDLETLADQVELVDLTTGASRGLFFSYQTASSGYICHNRVAIRPTQGNVFEPGHKYAAYMLSGILDKEGNPIAQPADLGALLGASAPADAALAPHYDKYAELRTYLSDNAIPANTILNATVFTVGDPTNVAQQLQGVIDAGAPPAATSWTLCDAGVTSPCPDATGERACAAADADFYELHALVELPIFQEGTAPYLEPEDGGNLKLNGGVPEAVRTEQVCMSLTVPKGGGTFSTLVHAHGTGGSFRSHVISGIAKDFAQGVDNGSGTVVKAAVLGIDQVQHGPRAAGSTKGPQDLFFNFANPKAARGNPQQGAADQMALLRFAPTVSDDGALTGESWDLTGPVAFWGHSQGATQGAIATPYGNWAGVFFSGQGAVLRDALVTKTSPVNIAALVPFVLQDVDPEGQLTYGKNHPVLSLLQHWIDPGDPLAYAAALTRGHSLDPDGHHTFMSYGQADTFTPADVQQNYALAAKLSLAAHDASVITPDSIGNLGTTATPVSGNTTVNSTAVTAVVRQYAPPSGEDGHFVAFDVTTARADGERFLAGALSGVTPQVGP